MKTLHGHKPQRIDWQGYQDPEVREKLSKKVQTCEQVSRLMHDDSSIQFPATRAGRRTGMNIALPFACLGIVIVSLALRHEKPSGSAPHPGSWLLLLVAVGASGAIAQHLGSPRIGAIWMGLVAGAGAAAIAAAIDRWKPHVSALIALGAVAPASVLMFAPGAYSAALAASFGTGVAALVFRLKGPALVSTIASVVCLSSVIATQSDSSFALPWAGVAVTVGIALASLASAVLSRIVPNWDRLSPVFVACVIAAIAYAASIRYLSLGGGWIGLCLAPVAALIAYWLSATEDSGPDAFGLLVSAAIWMGLATAAYGLSKSFGVSLALVLAMGTLVALDTDRAIASSGPLLAIVLTQAFRAIHPDAARSIEVGQHYVLIGLVLGALVPLLPEQWLDRVKPPEGWRRSLAVAVWITTLAAVPLLVGIYLAPKGLLGFVAGLGLSGFFGGLRSPVTLTVPALSAGLCCLTFQTYSWMGDLTDLPRDDKVHWIEYGTIGLLVATVALIALGAGKKESVKMEVA
jgi:hypothetical protein